MSVAITIDNVVKRFGKDTIINGLSVESGPENFLRCWDLPAVAKLRC